MLRNAYCVTSYGDTIQSCNSFIKALWYYIAAPVFLLYLASIIAFWGRLCHLYFNVFVLGVLLLAVFYKYKQTDPSVLAGFYEVTVCLS